MARWAPRTWNKAAKVARVAALVTLCVLLISPLRNVVLFPVLPGAWRTHSSLRLVRMLMDNQHFPVDTPFASTGAVRDPPSSSQVDLPSMKDFMEDKDPFEEFHRQRDLLEQRAPDDRRAAEELGLMESFRPAMTATERAQLLFTLDVFLRVCRQHGLTFFLFEGSLLGAYRHHGLVPWDDDVDIALNASQWRQVRRALGSVPGFTLYAPSDSQWKFYLSDLPAFHDKPFKWPNLDLFFFTEQDSYVWGLTWGVKHHLILHSRHLLPFTTVRWERWQLPVPVCAERMLLLNYDPEECSTPVYVHKTNKVVFGFQTEKIACSLLHKYYPFVFRRTNATSGKVVESRRVGDRVVEEITVKPPPEVCLE